jgi:uncharacterized lipoprotein NlpE involved in copper resistance
LKLVSILGVFVLFQISCNNGKEKNTGNTIPQKASANFSGIFSGLIPCANCPGIEVTLSFNPDSSFIESMIYQERSSSFKDSGHWIKDGRMIEVRYNNKKASPRYFLIKSDSTIAWLDRDKREIEGPLKDHYILKKK